MKKNIHPEYKKLKIKISEDSFSTYSTLKCDEMLMDVDFRKHPAWTKDMKNLINQSNKSVTNFYKKFGNISFTINK